MVVGAIQTAAQVPVQTRRDQPRLVPEEALTAAQERVQKLERALEVLGEDSGPKFQVLQNSLKKAKAAAQGVPVGFHRLQNSSNDWRSGCESSTQQRVARLRSELAAESPQHPPPMVPPDYVQELVQLRVCVDYELVQLRVCVDYNESGKIFVLSCRCEERDAVVGGAGHCPIHHPISSRESSVVQW